MHIYTTNTMTFWSKHYKNELHLIHEIDDDEIGFKSERHYILSRDAETKLFSIIEQKKFIEFCRKENLDSLEKFLKSNDIPYRIESF